MALRFPRSDKRADNKDFGEVLQVESQRMGVAAAT